MRRAAAAAIAIGALLAGEREGHVTQVMVDELSSLAELVGDAELIVVARPATPPSKTARISILPKGKQPDPSRYPPYVRERSRWVVAQVLRGDGLKPGQTIEVDEAYFTSKLELHRKYYVEHIGKSPIYRRYRSQGAPDGGDAPERILFLERSDGALAFTVEGAIETAPRLAEIKALLTAGQKP